MSSLIIFVPHEREVIYVLVIGQDILSADLPRKYL